MGVGLMAGNITCFQNLVNNLCPLFGMCPVTDLFRLRSR